MVAATGSTGVTPWQTVSRELQQLRNDGLIEFAASGTYVMLHRNILVQREDLSRRALDSALVAGRLSFAEVETGDQAALVRRRRGQRRLRKLSLSLYGGVCGVCDIRDRRLLIASHIVRWADDPKERGNLRNVLCLCRPHDALFEHGYWSLDDELRPIVLREARSTTVASMLPAPTAFRNLNQYPPDPALLRRHRERWRAA